MGLPAPGEHLFVLTGTIQKQADPKCCALIEVELRLKSSTVPCLSETIVQMDTLGGARWFFFKHPTFLVLFRSGGPIV